jgi:hypothetical protein
MTFKVKVIIDDITLKLIDDITLNAIFHIFL